MITDQNNVEINGKLFTAIPALKEESCNGCEFLIDTKLNCWDVSCMKNERSDGIQVIYIRK